MNMKLSRLLPLSIAVLSLAGFRADDTYTLKQVYKKDAVETYESEMTIVDDMSEIQLKSKDRYKVVSVAEDGAYEMEETTLEGTMKVNGQESAVEKTDPVVHKYDKDGKEVKKEGDDEDDPVSNLMSDLISEEPDHAVKVGESWDKEIDAGTLHCKLEGIEKVGDQDCLKLSIKGKLSKKDTSGESDGTIFVRVSDFSLQKLEVTLDNPKIGEASMKKIELKMTRVAD